MNKEIISIRALSYKQVIYRMHTEDEWRKHGTCSEPDMKVNRTSTSIPADWCSEQAACRASPALDSPQILARQREVGISDLGTQRYIWARNLDPSGYILQVDGAGRVLRCGKVGVWWDFDHVAFLFRSVNQDHRMHAWKCLDPAWCVGSSPDKRIGAIPPPA